MKKLLTVSISLLFMSLPLLAQDSTQYQGKAGVTDVADSDPGLFMVMMFMLIGFIAAVTLGVIATAVVCLILLFLIACGLISLSVIVGWYQRSFRAGIRWFVLSSFTLGGGMAGALTCALYIYIKHISFSFQYLLWFTLSGLVGGLLCGWIFMVVLRNMYRYMKRRYLGIPRPGR